MEVIDGQVAVRVDKIVAYGINKWHYRNQEAPYILSSAWICLTGEKFFGVFCTLRFTQLLHKGMIESVAYHHKKAVSTPLIILFKGHYLGDPVNYVDLTTVPLWSRV